MSRRVVHVITKLDVGGAQTHVVELALGQLGRGDEVEVVAGLGGPAAERLAAAGVRVRVVPELGASHGRASQRRALDAVTDALRATDADLIHGHSSNAGLAARVAARRLRRPSVYTAHGWPFQRGAPWKQRVMSWIGELVGGHIGDAVIVLTQAEYDRAIRARVVPRERLWIVPNGIADVVPSGPVSSMQGAPVLVMTARFAPPKLQAALIQVLAGLTDLDWLMWFVGEGPNLDGCQDLVRSLGLSKRVTFLGRRNDVADVLPRAHIGVLWSRYEGLPISVMEYMRAGLGCVARDLPGTRELLGAEAGLVAADESSLATALRALLGEPSRIAALGAVARQRYLARYSADAMVAATAEVYDAVYIASAK